MLQLNSDKRQVEYLGHIGSKDGVKPLEHKIWTIASFPKPNSAAELRRFFWIFNFHYCCIPKAAEATASLKDLLKGSPAKP